MSEPSRSSEAARGRVVGRRVVLAELAAAALLVVLPVVARAQSGRLLDAPRAAGHVGERFDGYAVVRPGAPPDVAALVERVNAERRAVYQQRAAAQNAPVEAVGKIYAAEIVKSAPAGTWFLREDGSWVRK